MTNSYRKKNMTRLLRLCAVGMLALCIPAAASAQKHKDRVLSTKHIQGKLVGFEVGDYMHAVIKTTAGKKRSFFIGAAGLEYFLAANKGKTFDLTYNLVDSYIEEAGGYQRITRLSDARLGKLRLKTWFAAERKKYPKEEDFNDHYNKLIEKLTLNNDS